MPILSNFSSGNGANGGLALDPVIGISTLTSSGKTYFKWTDPSDLVNKDNNKMLVEWEGTLLVRKAGSMPTNRRDGAIVLDSKVRDAYKTQYFCDSGLSNGVTYYYKFFPYSTKKIYTEDPANEVVLTPNMVPTGDVSNLQVIAQLNGRVRIMWNDPEATKVTDGITLSTWASTKVVYKAGSYPTSPDDGTLALNSTTRNAYSSSPLEVTGLTNGTTYYFALFPISTEGAVNTNSSGRITATPNRTQITAVPSQRGTLTYNGNEQAPVWNNYNAVQLSASGSTKAVNAGTYNITFTPTEDYCWSDGSTAAKTVTWTISRVTISATPSQSGTLTYNGNTQTPSWSNYNSVQLTLGGTTTGLNAGTYNATFTPTVNYKWSDGSVTAKTVSWSIGRATISAIPTQSGTLTYNKNSQSPSWTGYSTAKMTIGGTTSSQNAGTFTVTFTPTINYKWSDGSTTAKNSTWTINRAELDYATSKNGFSITGGIKSDSMVFAYKGGGTLTAKSSDTSIATVSVSHTSSEESKITVTGVKSGEVRITISVTASTNYNAKQIEYNCVVQMINTTLNDNTWAEIRSISDAGTGANYWSVGDMKDIVINGKVGNTIISNKTIRVFILGFNHNSGREGNNKIHFQVGKMPSQQKQHICFTDADLGKYSTQIGSFTMNPGDYDSSTNAGGWKESHMRKTILGSDSSPLTPKANTFLAALPSDLRAVMKSCTKYTDNVGNKSSSASNVTSTIDYLWLLSEFEVHGLYDNSNPYESNYQKQYEYYRSGNTFLCYNINAISKTIGYPTRSCDILKTTSFEWIGSVYNILTGSFPSGQSGGITPCFCV